MAEKTNSRNLQDLKNTIEYSELTGNETNKTIVHIIHISRYLSDPLHISQTSLDTGRVIDVYQLTVTDRKSKRKVILDPELGILVQNGQLFEGCCIQLEKCSVKYDETDLQQRTFLIVHQLSLIEGKHISLKSSEITDIPWCDDCDEIEKSPSPLSSSRGYFLNVWSSVELEGDEWKKDDLELLDGLGDISPVDLYTIKEISTSWRHLKCPPILVKVLCKKRILHYAKPSKNDKWPLQAHLTVFDRTGCATLVLWNSLCPEYYHRLQEGQVLFVQRFTVKKSFHLLDNSNYEPTLPQGLQMYDIDINLNSHHPVGQIKVISPATVPNSIKLPTIQFNFVQRKDLGCFPNDYICDITGVVTYVGRFYREKMTGKSGNDLGGFWISRWMEMMDSTSSKTFILHIYRPAEIEVYAKIHPGVVLVCRHMRIVNNVGHINSSRQNRSVYLTSTGFTCVQLVESEYVSHHVEDVVKWSASCSLEYTMAGYFSYPPLPRSLTELQSYYKDLQITTSDDIRTEIDKLCYKEHKRLFVQCKLVYILYFPAFITSRMEARQDSKKYQEMVVNEHLYHYNEEQIGDKVNPPFIYRYNREHIQNLLEFPSLFSRDAVVSDLETAHGCNGYFLLYWSGLNTKVLIPTIWTNSDILKPEDKLENLMCSSIKSLTGSQILTEREITQIITSAKECESHRFLLVLDIYKADWKQTEIVLNAAYKI